MEWSKKCIGKVQATISLCHRLSGQGRSRRAVRASALCPRRRKWGPNLGLEWVAMRTKIGRTSFWARAMDGLLCPF
mgnify:CR=1 FL=1